MSLALAVRKGSATKSWLVVAAALVAASVLTGCWGKNEIKPIPLPPDTRPKAIIKTKFGEMEMKFYPDLAPNYVENFIKLAKSGFYNGTKFHRVIPGFMIQGGDPNTKTGDPSTWGIGGSDKRIKAEFNSVKHKRGILSMARSNDPDSASSQFFIMVANSPSLDGQYSAFGEVTKGMEV